MKKIILLFLFLLFLPMAYAATTEDTPKVVDTKINVSIKGYMDGNVSKVNLTIFTEDETLNYNALSSSSTIYEIHEINMIRTLKCPLSNVEDLQSTIKNYFEVQECGEKSCAVRWAECKEAKAHVEKVKSDQDAELARYTTNGNYNIGNCTADKNALEVQYQSLLTEKTKLEKELQDNKSNKWVLFIAGLVIGALLFYLFGDETRKYKVKNAPHEKNNPQLQHSERPSSRIDEIVEKARNMASKKEMPVEEPEEEIEIPFRKETKKKESKSERTKRIIDELKEIEKEDG